MKMLMNSSGMDIAGTLDSSYYKGQGIRQGVEREFVLVDEDSVQQSKERPMAEAECGNGCDSQVRDWWWEHACGDKQHENVLYLKV